VKTSEDKDAEVKYVEQARAAVLLGIPEPDLCTISSEAGLGHKETNRKGERLYFTYEELRRICKLTIQRAH
jgi:hypothetical protein